MSATYSHPFSRQPPMINYHLNAAQRAFILKWIADNPERPAFGAYDKAQRAVSKLPAGRKPTPKSVPGTLPGFGKDQLVPGTTFNAIKQLPAGWAIVSDHDSGGNHRIHNAGGSLLTALWNCWSGCPAEPLKLEFGVFAERLNRQLIANKITLK